MLRTFLDKHCTADHHNPVLCFRRTKLQNGLREEKSEENGTHIWFYFFHHGWKSAGFWSP